MSTDLSTEDVLDVIDSQWRTLTDILNRVENRFGQDISDAQVFARLQQLEACGEIEKTQVKEPDKSSKRNRFRRVGSRRLGSSPAGGLAPA